MTSLVLIKICFDEFGSIENIQLHVFMKKFFCLALVISNQDSRAKFLLRACDGVLKHACMSWSVAAALPHDQRIFLTAFLAICFRSLSRAVSHKIACS